MLDRNQWLLIGGMAALVLLAVAIVAARTGSGNGNSPFVQARLTETVTRAPTQPAPSPTRGSPSTTSTPRSTATPTMVPSSTPLPGLVPAIKRQPSAPVPLGWPIANDGISLNLIRAELRSEQDGSAAALQAWFALYNESPDRILVEFNPLTISLVDGGGTTYVDWEKSPALETFWLEPGSVHYFDRYYSSTPQVRSRVPPQALPLVMTVGRLSRVESAQWVIEGPPVVTFNTSDQFGGIGTKFVIDGFLVALVALDIRTSSSGDSAAFKARYRVSNPSATAKTVDIDYAEMYVEDSFGNLYIDWDGAGLATESITPGGDKEFQRYYSRQSNDASRIPVGTQYVVLVAQGIGPDSRAQWKVDIVR